MSTRGHSEVSPRRALTTAQTASAAARIPASAGSR
eukprot:CAMPEP_0202832406 /NCGR_PEP_ID=MMETSP1389-20130828/18601_1 /ASSEMBLY_ACC=CAM_ASM_000865 /TAXON_ID=302021 /ORGANISM="Rhodomonas sp., Strain CCMP768" /LENGTH=34 /DNA_ID= /DNA_START= /DNA_END= /DNA_ORIENTATION=